MHDVYISYKTVKYCKTRLTMLPGCRPWFWHTRKGFRKSLGSDPDFLFHILCQKITLFCPVDALVLSTKPCDHSTSHPSQEFKPRASPKPRAPSGHSDSRQISKDFPSLGRLQVNLRPSFGMALSGVTFPFS